MFHSYYQKYQKYLYVAGFIGAIGSVGLLMALFQCQTYMHLSYFHKKDDSTKEIVKKDEKEEYLEEKKKLFKEMFESEENFEKWNANIDRVFYVKSDYQYAMENRDNSLEKIWRSRILMESTPRGNVIMYYDAYKHGFAYYSDAQIPYVFLNACAMKYVRLFFCRDFFIDQTLYPEHICSPFIRIHNIEKNTKKEGDSKFDVSKGPFAKLKNKNSVQGVPIVKRDTKTIEVQKKEPEVMKNKFIHLGKICNFELLQKSHVSKQPDIVKDLGHMSYSAFKSWRNPESQGGTNYLFVESSTEDSF